MERNPWWTQVEGPFPKFEAGSQSMGSPRTCLITSFRIASNHKPSCLDQQGPVGVKDDGGGCTRGCGRVGPMTAHRAACNQDEGEIRRLAERPGGLQAINEVEAAGNTPLHNAAYVGWLKGAELFISLGTDSLLI